MREGRDARENEKRKAAAMTHENEAKRQREEANTEENLDSRLAPLRRVVASYTTNNQDTRCELDSHADTCAFGKYAFIVSETSNAVSVAGFYISSKNAGNTQRQDRDGGSCV